MGIIRSQTDLSTTLPHTAAAEAEKGAPVQTSTDVATAVEPANDIAAHVVPAATAEDEVASPVSTSTDSPSSGELEVEQGWTFINYVFFFGFICVVGVALWFLGGNRLVKRIMSGKGKGGYRRVGEDDVEKQRD